jgi:hypothetical protein
LIKRVPSPTRRIRLSRPDRRRKLTAARGASRSRFAKLSVLVLVSGALVLSFGAVPSSPALEMTSKPLPRIAGCHRVLPIKPARVYLGCGRAAPVLSSVAWTSWTSSEALAKAIITNYTCSARCKHRVATSYHARVAFRDPVPAKSGLEFYILTVTYSVRHKVIEQVWINHQLFIAKKKA